MTSYSDFIIPKVTNLCNRVNAILKEDGVDELVIQDIQFLTDVFKLDESTFNEFVSVVLMNHYDAESQKFDFNSFWEWKKSTGETLMCIKEIQMNYMPQTEEALNQWAMIRNTHQKLAAYEPSEAVKDLFVSYFSMFCDLHNNKNLFV